MFQYVSAPETLVNPAAARRFLVRLISHANTYKAIDVCVVEPTLEEIATLLQAKGLLHDHKIVSCQTPTDCDCF